MSDCHDNKPALTEESITQALQSFQILQERAELIANKMFGNWRWESISFEECEDIDDSFRIEREIRTCGCCPGDTEYEYVPVRMLLQDFDEIKKHLEEEKARKAEEAQRQRDAERALQERKERDQLRMLQAKYGGAA